MTNPTTHPNLTPKKTVSQKATWKEGFSEFFHNYFIGISNLTCSEEYCPLVLNWDEIEEKNSKKGKCAFYQVSKKDNKFLVVDLISNEENDLGTVENIEVQFKSGKKQRTKPKDYIEPKDPKNKEIFLNPQELVLFSNNLSHTPNLKGIEEGYLEEMWEIREKIRWDRKASKKKIINWVEQKPDGEDKANKINEWEDDYIFYISNPDITSEIKAHEVYSTQNTKEREQLWVDYKEELSELRRVNGIEHITSKKEERMNNPEIEANQAQFIALERRKKRIREESIREAENKGFCQGKHILSYGSLQEHQQELEIEEIVKSEQSEQKESEEVEKTTQKPQELKENIILAHHDKK